MKDRAWRIDEALELGPRWVRRTAAPAAVATPAAPAASPVALGDGPPADRAATIARCGWDELEAAVAGCTACPLSRTRNKTVFGVGDRAARWLFVGEGPGAEEDARGEPFVGQAGKLLDNMLRAIGLERGRDVYIANIVKCRPPGNRNPEAEEAAACRPYLERQIALIQPRLIVALGRVAVTQLLGNDAAISSLRQRTLDYRGIPAVVTYHPAYLLRNLPDKAKAWEDLLYARDTLERLTGAQAG